MVKICFIAYLLWIVSMLPAIFAVDTTRQAYVVYMGSVSSAGYSKKFLRNSHLNMLASVVGSFKLARESLIYSYTHSINGFSAVISQPQADVIASMAGVVSVFPSRIRQLHTTRSWDFLASQGLSYQNSIPATNPGGNDDESDVIIGMVDTGVWPEADSFRDDGMGPIPSRWKGKCDKSDDFNSSNCNKKLIGARSYADGLLSSLRNSNKYSIYNGADRYGLKSARDTVGHGTHTASTAGGRAVKNASFYGLAQGTARGGAPLARIAVYKACSEYGCADADILQAFDDAIKDGVDILSLSIGSSPQEPPSILTDAIALGSFHAVQNGILVVCSAGNDGPDPSTVVNTAPWIFTVAASTIDRTFQSRIVLGNGRSFKGVGMDYWPVKEHHLYDLVYGGDIAARDSKENAPYCSGGSLDAKKAKGKIILCFLKVNDEDDAADKSLTVEVAGGAGMILAGKSDKFSLRAFEIAGTQVSNSTGGKILDYIKSSSKAKATILPAKTLVGIKPAPTVAHFSARGPSLLTQNILKPDISAPGVDILAAWTQDSPYKRPPPRQKPSPYAIISGTSMACPHVTGAATSLKSAHPTWSVSALKSALMTTARNVSGQTTWLDTGAGEVDPSGAKNPGLVLLMEPAQHCLFLCYYGISPKQISAICGSPFTCPANSNSTALISTLNYPSIAVELLNATRTLTRTLTNVGPTESNYVVKVVAPTGVRVNVTPMMLQFTASRKSVSIDMELSLDGAHKQSGGHYVFGSITFSDGAHAVLLPIAIST